MNDIHETIKDIKSKFRLFMNATVSQSLRDKGMKYKVIFGIEYPRLKEIASAYKPDHALAQALWKEDIRECKIMAGMLQPAETFYPEIAEMWMDDMSCPELAEYTVMTLFQRLPYASEVVFRWIADDREYFRLCGFLLMTRLLANGLKLDERAEAECTDQAFAAVEGDSAWIKRAASASLCKLALQSRMQAKKMMKLLGPLQKSEKPEVAAAAREIKNEIEYSL